MARGRAKRRNADLVEGGLGLTQGESALGAPGPLQILSFVLVCGGVTLWALLRPDFATHVAFLGAAFVSTFAFLRLAAAWACLSTPIAPPGAWEGPLPRYTVLCPLYKEARAVPGLMKALTDLNYPRDLLDIRLVLEPDDRETAAAAAPFADRARIVIAPPTGPRTKPKALNAALGEDAGPFLVVFDAEDRPHPEQLRAALAAFAREGPQLGCVQAPLLVDNAPVSWIARCFAAEYAAHFLGVLPLLARIGAPPILGGTSNHFRTEALRGCGGWDPYNVTEDADIGYRLAANGWRIGLIAPPTWEEAPVTTQAWVRQRSRWIKGHIQTWLVLMRAPVRRWRSLGPVGFASLQIMLLGGVLAAGLHLPLALILLFGVLQGAPGVLGAAAYAALGYAGATAAIAAAAWRLRRPDLLSATPLLPLYWPLASIAGVRALVELIAKPHYWAKTDHAVSPRPEPHAAPWTFPPLSSPRSSPVGFSATRLGVRASRLIP